MTNAMNSVPEKKAQFDLIVIGRQGKIRTCLMRSDVINSTGVNDEIAVPADKTLRQAIMGVIAEKVTELSNKAVAAKRPVNVEIYTVGQVAIKYYQGVKFLKSGHRPTTADIESLSYRNDGTRNNDTVEDQCAYADMVEALADAIAAGNGVHLQASGNAHLFELIVPQGVVLKPGDILNFVDGVAENGVQVRGWRNAKRQGAEVIVRGTKNPRAYITKAADPDKPWATLDTLLTTIENIWNELPNPNKDKSRDDGSLDDLFAA